jgi:hypothetical protein
LEFRPVRIGLIALLMLWQGDRGNETPPNFSTTITVSENTREAQQDKWRRVVVLAIAISLTVPRKSARRFTRAQTNFGRCCQTSAQLQIDCQIQLTFRRRARENWEKCLRWPKRKFPVDFRIHLGIAPRCYSSLARRYPASQNKTRMPLGSSASPSLSHSSSSQLRSSPWPSYFPTANWLTAES